MSITGLDLELIEKFKTISHTLPSKSDIDIDRFEMHAAKTRLMLATQHSRIKITPTLHKNCIAILKSPGQSTDRHADRGGSRGRRSRREDPRNSCRTNTMTDMLNMLNVSSNPLIDSLKELVRSGAKSRMEESLSLLKERSACQQSLAFASPAAASDTDFFNLEVGDICDSSEVLDRDDDTPEILPSGDEETTKEHHETHGALGGKPLTRTTSVSPASFDM